MKWNALGICSALSTRWTLDEAWNRRLPCCNITFVVSAWKTINLSTCSKRHTLWEYCSWKIKKQKWGRVQNKALTSLANNFFIFQNGVFNLQTFKNTFNSTHFSFTLDTACSFLGWDCWFAFITYKIRFFKNQSNQILFVTSFLFF